MSSLSNTTQDIDIRYPEHWTLILRLGESSISFILYSDHEENSLIYRELTLDKSTGDYLKSLENCIYDNPALLQDFKRVAVEIASSHFVVLPEAMNNDDHMHEVMDYMFATDGGDRHLCPLSDGKTAIAFTMPRGVMSFLQRTFNMPTVVHQLVPLSKYGEAKCEKSGISRMFAHLYNEHLDLCVFRKGELIMTNTYRLRNTEEAVFYMLNAWQHLGLDVMTDELQLSSDKTVRDLLTPQLRKYINFVMPIIFPASAMKIGQDAIKAPFDLILLSQCVL